MASRQAWRIDEVWYRSWRERPERAPKASTSDTLFSIIMPVYETPREHLSAAVQSVRNQSHPHWQLCIANDGSKQTWIEPFLDDLASRDPRIRVTHLDVNQGIAAASNAALALADGEWILPMDHDDLLVDHALATIAAHLEDHDSARFLYSDSDRVDEEGQYREPFFKPSWNYLLFLAQNYPNHLTVIDASLLYSIGGWREGFEGSQDYDLYLRLVEQLSPAEISRVPEVLYHWRVVETAFSQQRLSEAVNAARRAVGEHLHRVHRPATVSAPPGALIYNRIIPEFDSVPACDVLLISYGPQGSPVAMELGEVDERITALHLGDIDPKLPEVIDKTLQGATKKHVVLMHTACNQMARDDFLEMLAFSAWPDVGCVAPKCVNDKGQLLSAPDDLERLVHGNTLPWHSDNRGRGYHAHLLLQQQTAMVSPLLMAFQRVHWLSSDLTLSAAGSLQETIAQFCLSLHAAGRSNLWLGDITATFDDSVDDYALTHDELARACPGRMHGTIPARRFPEEVQWNSDS